MLGLVRLPQSSQLSTASAFACLLQWQLTSSAFKAGAYQTGLMTYRTITIIPNHTNGNATQSRPPSQQKHVTPCGAGPARCLNPWRKFRPRSQGPVAMCKALRCLSTRTALPPPKRSDKPAFPPCTCQLRSGRNNKRTRRKRLQSPSTRSRGSAGGGGEEGKGGNRSRLDPRVSSPLEIGRLALKNKESLE